MVKKQEAQDRNPRNTSQAIEFRHFIRHPLCLPLAYQVIRSGTKANKEEIRSETINISMGGLLFPAKHAVDTGVKILIKMPCEGKLFNIRATVLRCVKNSETNLYDIAVSFTSSPEAFKVKMLEQIYLIAEYRDLLNLEGDGGVTLEEASREWIKRYSQRFSKLYW